MTGEAAPPSRRRGPHRAFLSRDRGATHLLAVVLTAAITLLVVIVVLNLTAGEKKVKRQIEHLYSLDDPQFQRTLGVMLGPVILPGNRFEMFLNGDQIFPPMLEAIASARKTICFETYIYWSGDIGRQFAEALAERARGGVKVHVLLDWVGSSKMDKSYIATMEEAGVEIRLYHEPRWDELDRLNNRTHRKILVVDGATGFTGGVGIAPEWTGNAQDPSHWRDTHFKAVGPVVAQMQAVFADNWVKASGAVLDGGDYFPHLAPLGESKGQVFASSPSGGSESMELMYLLIINAAEHGIDLSAAYFVPDEISRDAIVAARKRGVRVRIITAGPHTDAEVVRRASRALWGDLLAAGVEIYEYQPTLYHVKVLVADNLLTSVGSTNFDDRSFRLNDEASLNIYDEPFAQQQTDIFEQDLVRSRRVTREEWSARPLTEKAWERVSALLAPQL